MTPKDAPRHRTRPAIDFMAASPYAHIAYTLDMTVLDLNWRHAQMTGVPREQVVGRNIYDVFPSNPDAPDSDAGPVIAASLDRMVETREPDDMPVVKHDLPAPGGGFRERYWQLTHSPIFEGPDGTGEIVGALQTTRDVTADIVRHKVLAAQRRAAMIGGRLVFFEYDIESATAETSGDFDEFFGLGPGEARADMSAHFERIHPEDQEGAVAVVDALRAAPAHTESRYDYRIVLPDGAIRWVTARFEVLHNLDGSSPRLSGMMLDISDLRRTENELRETIAARDMLLAEVNHRVKNSLQLVTSVLNLEATQADRADEAGADRLRASAARVRAIATVHAALYDDTDVRSVAFDSFLQTLCAHLATASGADTRGLSLVVDAEPVRLPTDRAISLSLIVNELVTNAFKHAFPEGPEGPEGPGGREGTVRVILKRTDADRIALEVSDDGTGAADAALAQNAAGSNGLGKRLIDTLARQLGAELHQEGNGTGVRVRLTLPLAR